MRFRTRRFAPLAILLALLIAVPVLAQSRPEAGIQRIATSSPAAAEAAAPAAAVPQQLNQRVYLPLVREAEIAVLFGQSVDEETGAIIEPSNVLPAGITRLYVNVLLIGYQNNTYRVEAIFPDGDRLVGSNETISQPAELGSFFLFTREVPSNRELPLAAGVYTIELFVNDKLYGSYQATLQ